MYSKSQQLSHEQATIKTIGKKKQKQKTLLKE